jgi:hypothetical protein
LSGLNVKHQLVGARNLYMAPLQNTDSIAIKLAVFEISATGYAGIIALVFIVVMLGLHFVKLPGGRS